MAKRKTMLEKLLVKQTHVALAEAHANHLECTLYEGDHSMDSIQREVQRLGLKRAYMLIREGTTEMAYLFHTNGVLRGLAKWPEGFN